MVGARQVQEVCDLPVRWSAAGLLLSMPGDLVAHWRLSRRLTGTISLGPRASTLVEDPAASCSCRTTESDGGKHCFECTMRGRKEKVCRICSGGKYLSNGMHGEERLDVPARRMDYRALLTCLWRSTIYCIFPSRCCASPDRGP